MSPTSIAKDTLPLDRPDYLRPAPAKHLPLAMTVPPAALTALAEVVQTWHQELVRHVERQEGPGGFMKFLLEAAPRYGDHLDRLRDDHRRLTWALGALRLKIARADAEGWESLVAEADAIADAIAEHDALEDEMLVDSLESP